jgi:hypothetical protein
VESRLQVAELACACGGRWSAEWTLSTLEKPPLLCTQLLQGHFESLYADLECVM